MTCVQVDQSSKQGSKLRPIRLPVWVKLLPWRLKILWKSPTWQVHFFQKSEYIDKLFRSRNMCNCFASEKCGSGQFDVLLPWQNENLAFKFQCNTITSSVTSVFVLQWVLKLWKITFNLFFCFWCPYNYWRLEFINILLATYLSHLLATRQFPFFFSQVAMAPILLF